jgi:splicing factor 45
MSFAPPPNLNDVASEPPSEPPAPEVSIVDDTTGEDAYAQRLLASQNHRDRAESDYLPPLSEPPTLVADDVTGEDAYARRLQMIQDRSDQSMANYSPPPPSPPPPPPAAQPPPPMSVFQPASATISRAPVRYTLPPPPDDIPATEEELEAAFAEEEPVDEESGEAPRSLRPGQQGFAERLMAKYGWTKGSGLGAGGSGIVNALRVKVEKQKRRPESEGGGLVGSGGRGKIIGSVKKSNEEGKFGPMSEVIVLHGMVDGMDLDAEMDTGQDGGLMQEIGEECAEKVRRITTTYSPECLHSLLTLTSTAV